MAEITQEQFDELKKSLEETQKKLKETNQESIDRRIKLDELKGKLSEYDGVDVEEYRKILDERKKNAHKKMVSEGDVEAIKKSLESEFQAQIKAANDASKSWQDRYKTLAVDRQLVAAAALNNAIDPNEVAVLTREHVKIDDKGDITVVDEHGGIKRNSEGAPMSIDGYVKTWLEDKPHHIKAGPNGSGGSGGSQDEQKPTTAAGKIRAGLIAMGQ